jgi:hypothetical protein
MTIIVPMTGWEIPALVATVYSIWGIQWLRGRA